MDGTALKLLRYQRYAVDWLRDRPAAFLALEQGLGKTVISAVDLKPPALVICTASMKLKWQEEINKWRPELRTQVLRGGENGKRLKRKRGVNVVIVNYDILHRARFKGVDTLIVDEHHKAKNEEARRTYHVMGSCQDAKRVRFLSGTPFTRSAIDVHPLLKATGYTRMDFRAYGIKYCAGWYTPWGKFDVSGSSNVDEWHERFGGLFLRMTKEQVLPEMPPKTYSVIELDLPLSQQEKEYKRDRIQGPDTPVPFVAIADIMKMNAERKLPLCLEFIKDSLDEDPDKKVVVFAHHREVVHALADGLSDYGVVKVMGGMSESAKNTNVQDFQTNGRVRVFVGNLEASKEGLTLTAANHVVFVECSWDPTAIDQGADRCHRYGQLHHVQVDILTIHKSIDAMMLRTALRKMEIIRPLLKETDLMSDIEKAAKAVGDAVTKFLTLLADQSGGSAPAAEAEEKPKVDKPKADKKQTAAEKAGLKNAGSHNVKLEHVRAKMAELIGEGKRDEVMQVLTDMGAGKVSELDESKYGDMVKALNAIGAEENDGGEDDDPLA